MSGPAAAHWAGGAALGEQKGAVYVNSKMVGLLFVPSWTDSVVLVSETARDTTLPLWAQYQYAQAVLNHFAPTSMILLDTYFSKGYISSSDPPTGAPVRHLAVNHTPSSNLRVPLYAPPNLVHTTSAAFMALLYLQSLEPQGSKVPGLLLLAPSSTLPPQPPSTIGAGEGGPIPLSDDAEWSADEMELVQSIVCTILGAKTTSVWKGRSTPSRGSSEASKRRTGDVGDGGMYI